MSMNKGFVENLKVGLDGEDEIEDWFAAQGFSVIPLFNRKDPRRGPVMHCGDGELRTIPDLLVMKPRGSNIVGYPEAFFVEVKNREAFSYRYVSKEVQLALDMVDYERYLSFSENSSLDMLVLVRSAGNQMKYAPAEVESPKGVYGGFLSELTKIENHRDLKYGKNDKGMVYWNIESLKKFQ